MVEDRRMAVLRAIVEDFVATREPVGSKALVERHHLDVSSATIRNDMAALEEEGYIVQPHTSAGRVPTDKGYRFFVDKLAHVKPLSSAERRAITTFLAGATDINDMVQRSVKLLAQLTRQVAIVQYPVLSASTVRHVELVDMGSSRLLAVLILSNGRVEQRVVEVSEPLADDDLANLRARVNAATDGLAVPEAAAALVDVPESLPKQQQAAAAHVVSVLAGALSDHRGDERIVVSGTSNLARLGDSFETSIKPILEALEEQVVLLKLLGHATAADEVRVQIGQEGPVERLSSTSVVSAGYGVSGSGLSSLGVVGPTRMDYPTNMAAVLAVARYVSSVLEEN